MTAARVLLRRHRLLLLWLFACTLAVRALVPAGYMPAATASGFVLELCPGSVPAPVPMAGMHHGRHDPPERMVDQPCAFAGLLAPALDGGEVAGMVPRAPSEALAADPLPTRVAVAPPTRLRPPLRGPPLPA